MTPDSQSIVRAWDSCNPNVVGTIVAVSVIAVALVVDAGSTTAAAMVGTMIVAFTATVGAIVTFTKVEPA